MSMNALNPIEARQKFLKDKGLYPAFIDGEFGPVSMHAEFSYRDQQHEPIPGYLRLAAGELGVREIPGNKDNPRILEYHLHTGLAASDDETPWCSAFINWVMDKSNLPKTNSSAARSWLGWGEESDPPRFGNVVILERPPSKWQGHVGFLICWDTEHILLLGGNQSNMVCVRSFARNRVIGFRKL